MKDFNQKYFTGDSAAHSRSVYKGSGYDPQDLNRLQRKFRRPRPSEGAGCCCEKRYMAGRRRSL